MVRLPFGEFPVAAVLPWRALDQFTHGWDLARATGQPTGLDPGLAVELLGHARLAITGDFRGPDGAARSGPPGRSGRGGAGVSLPPSSGRQA